MFELICKLFIKDYKNTSDKEVRERYGTIFSLFSICCNILMVSFKLIVSYITNFVSIRADALNNLSDVGSNIATLFGFKLANKHADSDHPYGHGRMEYVSGMVVSFLILYMGFNALFESFNKIIHPEETTYSIIALIVLLVSIGIKLVMFYINNKAGKAIESETFLAAGQDSFNDSIMTASTLICLIFYKITNINLDAYVGFVVSIFVIKSGIEIFKNVLDTILGQAPDKELIKQIEKEIMEHKHVLGIHDLLMHDYGPSSKFMSVHAEVDSHIDVMELHDIIDNIEMEILDKYGILTTIHMDPIDTKDKLAKTLKTKVKNIVLEINSEYNIHDFRMVKGSSHTNLVFDVVIPASDESSHEEVRKIINDNIKEKLGNNYNCVITVEHSFV